ncbi:MAG: glycosyltransferase [Candidatus Dormibacteria bacterium]
MVRHTQYQLREVLRRDSDNDYLLVCGHDADESLILPEIRGAPNATVHRIPSWLAEATGEDAAVLRIAEGYQEWLLGHHLDVYHATTPFYDEVQPAVIPAFDVCPMVATLYDLIPLIYPEHYLSDPVLRRNYLLALGALKRASRVLAISEASRQDGIRLLGMSPDQVDVAWPVASPCFRPIPREAAALRLTGLPQLTALPDHFVLMVTARHHTKNMENSLRAYAMLAPRVRTEFPLVFGGHLGDPDPALTALLIELGIVDDAIFTGLLSDDQLAALYNLATLVVHVSRYEGFGLPVLEAMRCGTPVITSTTSSLPEVAGAAGITVDPDDRAGLASALDEVLHNRARRQTMRAEGLRRAEAFSDEQLAGRTRDSYVRALADATAPQQTQLTVSMWAPVPPQASGVADFSAELMDSLGRSTHVECFVDDGVLPSSRMLERHRIHHFSAFGRRQCQAAFDVTIYQFGASYFHRYMWEPMLDHAGVLDLHDLSWSRLIYHEAIIGGNRASFERLLQALEGEPALRRFRSLPKAGTLDLLDPALAAFLDDHLMLRRIIDRSRGQIVHFPAAKTLLEDRYANARPYMVPMGVADPYPVRSPRSTAQIRSILGIGHDAFIVGVFGIIDPIKRVEASLHALQALLPHRPDSVLALVGQVLDPDYESLLHRLSAELGISDHVRLLGRVSRDVFDDHMIASDVVVNLRYPTQRQMSAIIMRAAAAGKPVIVSDIADWDFIPSDFCWRIPSDASESSRLASVLIELATHPALLVQMSVAARSHYLAEGTMELMGARYREVISDILDRPGAASSRADALVAKPLAVLQAGFS